MPASITVTGQQQVEAKLDSKKLTTPMKQALQNAANNVAQVAKQNAPYRTGFLRANIEVESVTEKQATIVSNAEYSVYQKVDFMGMALQSAQAQFLRDLQAQISRALGSK